MPNRPSLDHPGAVPLLQSLEQANKPGRMTKTKALSIANSRDQGNGQELLDSLESDGYVHIRGFEPPQTVTITETGRKAVAHQVSPGCHLVLHADGDAFMLRSASGKTRESLTARQSAQIRALPAADSEARTNAATEVLFGTKESSLLARELDKLGEGEWARVEVRMGNASPAFPWEFARAHDGMRLAARPKRWVSFVRCYGGGTHYRVIEPDTRLVIATGAGEESQARYARASELQSELTRAGWAAVGPVQCFETSEDLALALRPKTPAQAKAPVVVYLLSHGVPGRLVTDKGSFGGEDLAAALSGAPACRLVVLGVCHGGDASEESAGVNVARQLVAAGVPWVIAPLGRADLSALTIFAHAFFEELWGYGGVERATWRGRREMHGADPAYPVRVALFAGSGHPVG